MKLLESVQILRLKPGDVLVVEVDRHLDDTTAQEIRTRAAEQFPGHKIVITSGVKLRVTREESA